MQLTSEGLAGVMMTLMMTPMKNANLELLLKRTTLPLVTCKPPMIISCTAIQFFMFLGAVKPFTSTASSPSNADVMSSGKGTLVSKSPSPPQTRRLAKSPSLNKVHLHFLVINSIH